MAANWIADSRYSEAQQFAEVWKTVSLEKQISQRFAHFLLKLYLINKVWRKREFLANILSRLFVPRNTHCASRMEWGQFRPLTPQKQQHRDITLVP